MYSTKVIAEAVAVLLIGLTTISECQEELTCYKCITLGNDGDRTCLDSPDSLNNNGKVTCPSNYHCTLVRTEFTDIPGRLVSLVRDCQLNPAIRNEVITDAHYTKFYRACTTPSCNNGNGITALGPNGGSGLPGEPIQVPRSSAHPGIVRSTSTQSFILPLLASLTVRIFL